ncbi:MAG TPA: gamma carbonic anhydrase family protein [Methanoregulaceae archaeon]|nr:gamma carbonic anhydrase family protein [Methanoregulaceae archaeon]
MSMDTGSGNPEFIAPDATILGDVSLSGKVSIWFGAVVRADKDRISIGEGSNIQDNAVVHTSKGFPVLIGDGVSVGHGAILHGCTVGNYVLVGMGAIVMNGAVIGERSILGAGTVITEGTRIPPHSVVLGVPGKVIRQTTGEQDRGIIRNAESYIELAKQYRND